MKVLLVLAAIAAVSSAYRYRPSRDIGLNLRGQIQTSYSSDNDLYVPPVSTNHVPQGYDYAKPPPAQTRQQEPQQPSRIYLPNVAPPPPSTLRYKATVHQPFETNFLPLPTETRPTYAGSGPYIWDYVSEGDHKVEVQDPFHQYQVRFTRH